MEYERKLRLEPPMWSIAHRFVVWTVRSALRSGSPVRSRKDIEAVLGIVPFSRLFDEEYGPIHKAEFTEWHKDAISRMMDFDPRLTIGWAAKMIANYLKTTCYLAGFGRDGLRLVIHPPVDNKLMRNLLREFRTSPAIMRGLRRFDTITRTDRDDYTAIMAAFELVAEKRGCTLFEVEQFWT